MNRLLSALEADLLIEQGGHRLLLSGSALRFVVTFPTLSSLLHFARIFWAHRSLVPPGLSIRIKWRQWSLPVTFSRAT